MMPGSSPFGAPSVFGQSVGGKPETGFGFGSYTGPNSFAIASATSSMFSGGPVICTPEHYQAQTSSPPSTSGGWILSSASPTSTFPNQLQVPSTSTGTIPPPKASRTVHRGNSTSSTLPKFTFPSQPQVPGTSTGTTPRVNSMSSTLPAFNFPSQPQVPSTSTRTPWGNSTSSTLPVFTFLSQPKASSTSTGTWGGSTSSTLPAFTFPSQPQIPSTSTGTTPWGSSMSSALPMFTFLSQPQPSNLSTTSFPPRGTSVASYVPTPGDGGLGPLIPNGYFTSISAMPLYQNKSHEELRLEDYQTSSCNGPQATSVIGSLTFGPSTFSVSSRGDSFSFSPRGGAVFSDVPTTEGGVPAADDENFISISATPAYCNKSHEELRLENYNASRPIQPHTSSATSTGFGGSCCCGSLFQKQKSTEAGTLANLLTSALSTHTHPIGIGYAGQFSPDTPVLCQLQSSTSVVPTGAEPWSKVTSTSAFSTQTSTPTAFTWSEPGHNVVPQKTQNAPETQVSTDKISGESTEGTLKSETPNQSSGVQPYGPMNITINTPAFTSPSGVPFMSPPSPAPTSQCGISSIPTLSTSTPIRTASLSRARNLTSGRRCRTRSFEKYKMRTEGRKVPFYDHGICEATTSLIPTQNPKSWVQNSTGNGSLETELLSNLSLLEQKSSKSETVGKSDAHDTTKDGSGSSAKLKLNISVPLDASSFETDEVSAHDVEAMMPKIRSPDYYTSPPILELIQKERLEPGFCSRVKDFVVGRSDHGYIKFLGETDVRNLDLESMIKFEPRELTLYKGDGEKPEAGKGLNKPAEVTLLNVKCIEKSTGKECVDGPKVDKFRKMLVQKAEALGVEFVSYVPVTGEWKFRVQHF